MEHERSAFGGLLLHLIWMKLAAAAAAATSQNASVMLCQLRHDEAMMDTREDLVLEDGDGDSGGG